MRGHLVWILLLALGCTTVQSDGIPASSEGWAARCTRIAEDQYPNKEERFEACVERWNAWAKKQKESR